MATNPTQEFKPDRQQVILIACFLVMITLFAMVITVIAKNKEITTKYNDLVLEARQCTKYYEPERYIPFVEEKEDIEHARNFSNI